MCTSRTLSRVKQRARLGLQRRRASPEPFALADELAFAAEQFLLTLGIHESDGLTVVKATLLLRLISSLDSLSLLASQGFHTEAIGQKRSMMEALARLCALSKDPSLLQEYLMQDRLNRKKIMGDILQFRQDWPPELPREPSDDEIRDEIAANDKAIEMYDAAAARKLRDIKTLEWARRGEVQHLFLGSYTISSQALHHAPRDLDRRFVIEDDKLVGLAVGPEQGDIETLLLDAAKLTFVGAQWFAESISVDLPDGFDRLYERHGVAYERLISRLAPQIS